jgi:PAS domain S-box-containing protein
MSRTAQELSATNQEPPSEPFRLLVESVTDYAIFMLDAHGHVQTWNPGAARIKQYQAEEIIGQHFSVFYPPEDVSAGKCDFELAAAARTGRFEEEGWRVRKDGSRFWAHVVITAIRSAEGNVRGFAKVTRDLTERRQTEEQLRQSEQRLRLLLESIQDHAIFMLDPAGLVTTWNSGAERVTRYQANEIIGKHFSTFYAAEAVQARHPQHELEVAAATGRYEEEGWRIRKDGSAFWANVVISAIRDQQQQLLGFAKITRDLTERRNTAREQTARLAAEEANRAKDEFLAMLGHELRNPLAPTLTALQLLKLRRGAGVSREHQIIERQIRHMVRLVDDLLDVSRITRGTIELKKERVELRETIARAIEIASPLIEERRHQLDVDVPAGDIVLYADGIRLAQVFANLLTNAAKYTDPGGHIRLLVRAEGGEIVAEVHDDGIGISPELLPRVFDTFVQAPQSAARSAGGLGIGLSLVRSFVQRHGGSVGATSPGPGRGSCFVVRLPLPEAQPIKGRAEPRDGGAPRPSKPSLRVLVVDDNEDALVVTAEVLRMTGHDVRTATSGQGALDLVRDFMPDVAILDVGLPGMDGYELGERLRRIFSSAPPRLIAMTGYGQGSDRERSGRAGFDLHLVKPVDIEVLMRSVDAARASASAQS